MQHDKAILLYDAEFRTALRRMIVGSVRGIAGYAAGQTSW
jgi:hypothetical protein